jgi:hypothetical protein
MKGNFKTGVLKLKFGFRLILSGFVLDRERIKYGFFIFRVGVLDVLKISNYSDIKKGCDHE